MKRFLILMLTLLLLLTACQTKTETPAELYLGSHSEEEIVDYFSEVTLFYFDFDNSQKIPEKNLYTFAMFHEKESWFNEEERLFYIPLTDIYDILDDYLIDYNLPVEWFEDTFANYYDSTNQQIIEGAIGMGTGCTAFSFISAEAIDCDNIKVTLLEYCEDPEMRGAGSNVYITAQIVGGKAKFTSCKTVKND